MQKLKVALIEGDGIGPEVSNATLKVLEALKSTFNLNFEIQKVDAGDRCLERKGRALPEESLDVIKGSKAILKGPVGNTAMDVVVRLRQMFDLYANIRPVKNLPKVPSLKPNIDFIIVRENTEDLYKGYEFNIQGGAIALRIITEKSCRRIAEYAFKLAEKRKGKIVAVHKANVLRLTDGLFVKVCKEVASNYPHIEYSEMLVDAMAMNLIRNPENYDVILTTNVFGDILSDEAAQLVGGLGLAPSANLGDDKALFEPVHGAAPDIAGKGIANPLAMILSSKMMLDWFFSITGEENYGRAGEVLVKSVIKSLEEGFTTLDLGGDKKTMEVADFIIRELKV
ncbi:MAG: isocitrate/isopropylmalate dehydrogenase family protein [Nitrososphaerales archaeon]